MKNYALSVQKLAHFLIALTLGTYILIVSKSILVPLMFGAFFAAMLIPLSNFFETATQNRVSAILLSFLTILVPVLGITSLFAYQIVRVINDMPNVRDKIDSGIYQLVHWLGGQLGQREEAIQSWLTENLSGGMSDFLPESLSSLSSVIAGLLLTIIFTFFWMLYRTSLKNYALYQFDDFARRRADLAITQIRRISQKYLYGLLVVILILGGLNSLGLWIIGVDYALFWGFLGAFLAIIPYVGTTLGGLFPFLYSLATADSWWQPVSVVILYTSIQSIEGNFITPKIVGNSVKINPFAAILALLVGGAVWGIAGLILALPVIAIIRIVFMHIEALKPVSELLSENLYKNEAVFEKKYNENRYRILNYFKDS
ncbi:MAG TPA: AI-2E family transporter [Saprospiraceae bacterium]|nr:AI-2E family transporter [Saprospiraceae bacterium]HMQ84688.1 AI-2E family transporter [Saprospiraceae bacterium]